MMLNDPAAGNFLRGILPDDQKYFSVVQQKEPEANDQTFMSPKGNVNKEAKVLSATAGKTRIIRRKIFT